MNVKFWIRSTCIFLLVCNVLGCQTTASSRKVNNNFPILSTEAQWIRDGLPIEFEGSLWYPADTIESLTDEEVYLLGTFKEVQFFIEKTDVRPFNRVYTKFSRNKFRYFKKRTK
jgi:hypothetical protein